MFAVKSRRPQITQTSGLVSTAKSKWIGLCQVLDRRIGVANRHWGRGGTSDASKPGYATSRGRRNPGGPRPTRAPFTSRVTRLRHRNRRDSRFSLHTLPEEPLERGAASAARDRPGDGGSHGSELSHRRCPWDVRVAARHGSGRHARPDVRSGRGLGRGRVSRVRRARRVQLERIPRPRGRGVRGRGGAQHPAPWAARAGSSTCPPTWAR